jgi:hypothetical protein
MPEAYTRTLFVRLMRLRRIKNNGAICHYKCWPMVSSIYLATRIDGGLQQFTSPLLVGSRLEDGSSVPVHSNSWQRGAVYSTVPRTLFAGRRYGNSVPGHYYSYLAALISGRWKQCTSPILLVAVGSSVHRHSYC